MAFAVGGDVAQRLKVSRNPTRLLCANIAFSKIDGAQFSCQPSHFRQWSHDSVVSVHQPHFASLQQIPVQPERCVHASAAAVNREGIHQLLAGAARHQRCICKPAFLFSCGYRITVFQGLTCLNELAVWFFFCCDVPGSHR